jgi:23S rRNA pseudouridine2605 synthase
LLNLRSDTKLVRRPTNRPTPRKRTVHAKRVGLARALSKLGYCSRSQAAELIRAGRVQLNSAIKHDPETPVQIARDRITVDSRPIRGAAKIYLMLNKPRGLVTTASDERGRNTIYSCLSRDLPWLAPVGRLDKASEGLLLLTNDSEWAAKIAAPESHTPKIYHVQIGRIADEALLDSLKKGVRAETEAGAETLRAKEAQVLRQGEHNSWLSIVLDEGKNRQIRRMFEALGIEVRRLIRVAIGTLELGDLPKGASRPLTQREVAALKPR